MPEAASLFAVLLLPVALILFMTRNFGLRLRHPHDLLERTGGPRFARLFFRQLRSRYDLLFDVAIALALSFALLDAGSPLGASRAAAAKGRAAVVIDCSRSMFAGAPGLRPIDAALEDISRSPQLASADHFALVFDPERRESRLLDWKSLARVSDLNGGEARRRAVDNLLSSISLFSVDYRALESLPAEGYRDISLVTDSFPMEAEGFRVIETGFAGPSSRPRPAPADGGPASSPGVDEESPSVWPSGLRIDRTRGAWLVGFSEGGRRTSLSVDLFDPAAGDFAALSPTRYAIEEGGGGRRVIIDDAGVYRFEFTDPEGGIPSVFVASLGGIEVAARAEGNFSRLMEEALPYLVERPRPSILLVDGSTRDADATASTRRIGTILAESAPFVADPALLGGRPLAAGFGKDADFVWAAPSLANGDLPLAYDAAIREAAPRPFATAFPKGGRVRTAGPGAWIVEAGGETAAIDAPAGEYFEPAKSGSLALRIPPRSWLWAAILAVLAIAKYSVWRFRKGPSRSGRA